MQPQQTDERPIIGITCGDINGIGPELIIKTLSDSRILDFCIPVVFANNRLINFYRKNLPEHQLAFAQTKELSKLSGKQVNLFNSWEDDVEIKPGELNAVAGSLAVKSLMDASQALKDGLIHGMVTAPLHKKNVQSANFSYTGHTPFLKNFFAAKDVVMMLVAENMRVALLTEHIPVSEVAATLTKDKIVAKLQLIQQSLVQDFGITRPKIAVLALNPHAGDEGVIGKEEAEIISPAIADARKKNILAFGPYPADAFFARGQYNHFDAVLAMYHDQGLIPFKSLAIGEGVNYTAGLQVVRTSPDHGTAFDIAGKGLADASSFREAIFAAIDIVHARAERADQTKNPMKKITAAMLRNAVDEKIED